MVSFATSKANTFNMVPGALRLEKLKRIVVDMSYIDQKKRGILSIPELEKALIQLLNREEIKSRYNSASDRIELLFY